MNHMFRLAATAVALFLATAVWSDDRILLTDVRAGEVTVDLDLEPFSITTPETRFVLGRRDGVDVPLDFDPSQVTLLRGRVAGQDGSHAFVAQSDRGLQGIVDLGAGRGWRVIRTVPVPASHGLGTPPPPEFCGLHTEPADLPGEATLGPPSPIERQVELAIETDYEYFQLFEDVDAACEYVLTLYGAVSEIYRRDVDTRLDLTFVRIWDTPDDLFNEDDPLGPFRDHWNENMGEVHRDLAQFLTGRRNLPYGGVAWLDATCQDHGYSVSGYTIGSFGDPDAPSTRNWDLIVTAHELGHNCGTGHTHSNDIDECNAGVNQRGTIMSYCHTTSGGSANIDLRFHTGIQAIIDEYLAKQPSECIAVEPDPGSDPPPDCNGNGVPDYVDIEEGTSTDLYGNGIPDECETDCNGVDGSDYNELQLDMSLDLDRNAVLDACQDCDDDGVTDGETLGGALNLWVAGSKMTTLREFHAGSGVPVKDTAEAGGDIQDVVVGPDGTVYATSRVGDEVVRFDPATGDAMASFVTSGDGGLTEPAGLTFGSDGDLYVVSSGNAAVLKYDGGTGVSLGTFVLGGAGGLSNPHGLAFGPNGNLFVTDADGRVVEFNGGTGNPMGSFVSAGVGGLTDPRGLLFLPNGNLIVASYGSDAVLEYDGTTGAFIDQFDRGGLDSGFWGLRQPWGLRIGPRADVVYVTSHDGNAAVHTYTIDAGLFMRSYYVLAADIQLATGIAVMSASDADVDMNLIPDVCEPDDLEPCAADLDGDSEVGVLDLIELLVLWGPCEGECPGDFDGDGEVGVLDLVALISTWGVCE